MKYLEHMDSGVLVEILVQTILTDGIYDEQLKLIKDIKEELVRRA